MVLKEAYGLWLKGEGMATKDKPKVVLTKEAIQDIREGKHPGMTKQAFNHIFDDNGDFKFDRADHPYKGLAGGWIRWVSMGGVGLRLIYIRKGDVVYLHRIVGKGDEDGIKAPRSDGHAAAIESLPEDLLPSLGESVETITRRILTNHRPVLFREAVRRMYHLPHSEIILISPNVSFPLFRTAGEIGRFLDKAIEDGSLATLITKPAISHDIEFFDDLARRNVQIYFVQNLATRLYLFRVNEFRVQSLAGSETIGPTAMIGSAELTHHSLDLGAVGKNEELCYAFPESHFEPFYSYADGLLKNATDLQGYKLRQAGGIPR